MNSKEILENLNQYKDKEDEGYVNNCRRFGHGYDFDEEKVEKEFGKIEYLLTDERLADGDHDTSMSVIYFEDHDVYIAITGYYSSHDGTEFDEMSIVKPEKVTIIKYKQVKD